MEYCEKAIEKAEYKKLEDGTWFAEVPGFHGVWASSNTVEECRKELILCPGRVARFEVEGSRSYPGDKQSAVGDPGSGRWVVSHGGFEEKPDQEV